MGTFLTIVLAHPINAIKRKPPPVLTSSGSVDKDGSYVVTVHRKKLHARTEISPPTNQFHDYSQSPCSSTITASPSFSNKSSSSNLVRDASPTRQRARASSTGNLRALRKQASVLNILNLYDDDGAIPLDAFSNTPRSSEFLSTPLNMGTVAEESRVATTPSAVMKEYTLSPISTSAALSPEIFTVPIIPLNVPSSSRPPFRSVV